MHEELEDFARACARVYTAARRAAPTEATPAQAHEIGVYAEIAFGHVLTAPDPAAALARLVGVRPPQAEPD